MRIYNFKAKIKFWIRHSPTENVTVWVFWNLALDSTGNFNLENALYSPTARIVTVPAVFVTLLRLVLNLKKKPIQYIHISYDYFFQFFFLTNLLSISKFLFFQKIAIMCRYSIIENSSYGCYDICKETSIWLPFADLPCISLFLFYPPVLYALLILIGIDRGFLHLVIFQCKEVV